MTKKDMNKEIKLLNQMLNFYMKIPFGERSEEVHDIVNKINIRLYFIEIGEA